MQLNLVVHSVLQGLVMVMISKTFMNVSSCCTSLHVKGVLDPEEVAFFSSIILFSTKT